MLELYPGSTASSSVRLGIAVPDIFAAVEAVRALGAHVGHAPSAEHQAAVVRDPDDNAIELSQA